MQVKEIMTGHVECVPPTMTVAHAAEKMRLLDVGALPICENDRLIGMVTDRDIALRAVAEDRPASIEVRRVMTPGITCVFEDDDVERAAQLMKRKQIRRLAVLSRDKRLVGIVSLGDIAVRTHDHEQAGDVLECVSDQSHTPAAAI